MRHHLAWCILLACSGRSGDLALLDEVLAGAEGAGAGAGDDAGAEGGLFVEPVEKVVGFPVGGVREGVLRFGSVDGY